MLKSKRFYFFLLIAIVLGAFLAKKYTTHKTKDEVAYLMESSPEKVYGTLLITSGIPHSRDMASGILCIENADKLSKVDLFMPDMGHGSEPPKVTQTNVPKELSKYVEKIKYFGCYSIESMQLFMPGTWQVRVFYKNKTMGIFTLNLKD